MTPKHHEVNDSVNELVTIGKDVLRHRQKFPQASCR